MKPDKPKTNQYQCHICGKTFETEDELREHIKIHVPQPAGIEPEGELPKWESPRHSG